ncbi:MAG: hypothetical protein MK052_05875 [Alphaproteobacteria bacterium]|nr:hypothetical protein [Alphaproteobacteria bacterium]
MSGGQTKNAALSTALAFHYQVLIGLEKCLSLQEGQSVWFEKDGDVSLVGDAHEESSQIEVKNYANPLTDHHENFWNTLNNWLDPKFNHEQYGALVLHTTQAFGATTRLKDWNIQNTEQRLSTLSKIYDERTSEELNAEKPKKIVTLQKAVMEADKDILCQLVAKVSLFTETDDATALESEILARPVGIPRGNRKSYLHGLVGFVYSQADKQYWKITQAAFSAKCEELTSVYCKKEFTFPPFTGNEAFDIDVQQHQEKLFVQKIKQIEHHNVIPDAIGNWIELQNSLNEQLHEYPIYKEKTKSYQKQIIKRFNLLYSSAQLKLSDPKKESKIFYNDTIAELPMSLENNTPPIEYKNGLIHDAMDDEEQDLKWKIES